MAPSLKITAALAVLLALGSPAHAEDPKQDSPTVLPWPQATLSFSSEEKLATVEYTQLFSRSWALDVKLSAPIDEDTRVAAFVKERHLSSGFMGSLQFGFDQRAKKLDELATAVEKARTARDALMKHSEAIPHSLQERFIKFHGIDPSGVDASFCKKPGCTVDDFAQAACPRLQAVDCDGVRTEQTLRHAAEIVVSCRQLLTDKATMKLTDTLTAKLTDDEAQRCFIGYWLTEKSLLDQNYRYVSSFVLNTEQLDRIWSAFETIDPEKAKDLESRGRKDAILSELELFESTLRDFVQTAALKRRDVLLTAIPLDDKLAFAVSVDGRVSYDRLSIYQDDLASEPVVNTKYSFGAGANLTLYTPVRGLAFTARTGLDRERDPGADTVERCTPVSSTDPAVTGRKCDAKALFRSGAADEAETSGYLRLAATYQLPGAKPSKSDFVPGVEARLGIEGLRAKESLSARLTLFGTPVKGTNAARVGVALDLSYALDTDSDSDESRWTITPLIFVGATFSDLLSSHL